MRLDEFYDPENDQLDKREAEDTRKNKLTLEDLNKLRKYRDIKQQEKQEHEKFVRVMYAQPAAEGGGLPGI
jgi:hypothetical protein